MPPPSPPPSAGTIEVRVRYVECDPMGVAHHSAFAVWFEMGRTELLRRSWDVPYRELESGGVFFAVTRLDVRYRRPAFYDDLLTLHTRITGSGRAKIEHGYELYRDGRPRPLPESLAIWAETTAASGTAPP